MQFVLSTPRTRVVAGIATVAIIAPVALYLARNDEAHANQSATAPLATIKLHAFDYATYSLGLFPSYTMNRQPQASTPVFPSSRTFAPVDGDNYLQLGVDPASAASYTVSFSLEGTRLKEASVPSAAGSVGVALRSDGSTTHTWHVNITLQASNGKTYSSGYRTFALNSAAWTKSAVPLTSTVPAGVSITEYELSAYVDEGAKANGTDGYNISFDDLP